MKFSHLLPILSLCLYGVLGADVTTPHEALHRLMEGNDRFVHDKMKCPNRDQERREAIIAKQTPFAAIIGCADSRVSPEIVFDQGVGDIFVVRVAGNVVGPLELDSLDYAVIYLKAKIIVVMGHENCGAVDAVIQGTTKDIESVAELINPAVLEAKRATPINLLELATKKNALNMRATILKSPAVAKLVKEKQVEVYAAYFNLQTGKVHLLKDNL